MSADGAQEPPGAGCARRPVLVLRELCSGGDEHPQVRGVDLEVAEGEVVALLGVNGSGRTTVLRTVAGLLTPDSGRIELFGVPEPTRGRAVTVVRSRARRGVAFVPEDRALFPSLTVSEHLRLGASRRSSRRRSLRSVRPEVGRVLEWMPELEDRMHTAVALLSGGEQQLVALATALVADPKLLLVDELSAGLAPKMSARLVDVLRSSADQRGTAVLAVDQRHHPLVDVADRAHVLDGGNLRVGAAAAARPGDSHASPEARGAGR